METIPGKYREPRFYHISGGARSRTDGRTQNLATKPSWMASCFMFPLKADIFLWYVYVHFEMIQMSHAFVRGCAASSSLLSGCAIIRKFTDVQTVGKFSSEFNRLPDGRHESNGTSREVFTEYKYVYSSPVWRAVLALGD